MGELARKYGGPQLPETPLDLITPRPGEGFSPLEKWTWAIAGAAVGLSSMLAYNLLQRRPWWASVHRTLIGTGLIMAGTKWIAGWKEGTRIETDAIIKHYISLHPEDFPPFERKRWAEIYQPFKPVR